MKRLLIAMLLFMLPTIMLANKLGAADAANVTKKYVVSMEKDDIDGLKKCLSKEVLKKVEENGGIYSVALPSNIKMEVVSASAKVMDDKKRAKVKVNVHVTGAGVTNVGTMVLVAENGEWKIAQLLGY
jgi:hypothetical protein